MLYHNCIHSEASLFKVTKIQDLLLVSHLDWHNNGVHQCNIVRLLEQTCSGWHSEGTGNHFRQKIGHTDASLRRTEYNPSIFLHFRQDTPSASIISLRKLQTRRC